MGGALGWGVFRGKGEGGYLGWRVAILGGKGAGVCLWWVVVVVGEDRGCGREVGAAAVRRGYFVCGREWDDAGTAWFHEGLFFTTVRRNLFLIASELFTITPTDV